MTRAPLDVNGAGMPVYALKPVRGGLSFVVLDGRAPAAPDEAVIGPASAKALGKTIGDCLAERGALGTANVRIVGTAFLPQTIHSEFDQGVWVLPAALVGVDDPEVHADDTPLVTAQPSHRPPPPATTPCQARASTRTGPLARSGAVMARRRADTSTAASPHHPATRSMSPGTWLGTPAASSRERTLLATSPGNQQPP